MELTRKGFVAAGAGAGATMALGAAGLFAYAEEGGQGEKFDETYDVVVIGYGFAGGTSAIYAADNGARVLLVDVAPEGHEGGNSRYCGQLTLFGDDQEKLIQYFTALGGEMEQDPEVIEAYTAGMVDMRTIYARMGVENPCIWSELVVNDPETAKATNISNMYAKQCPEYPELPGSDGINMMTAEPGAGAMMLYGPMQDRVAELENITVWLESPARHLIQDPDSGAVVGVVVEHEGAQVRVGAGKGVVLACGGFECNEQMKQDYLGVDHCEPLGGTYNNGDGITMAREIGADLWHMHNYESLGGVGGNNWEVVIAGRGSYISPFAWPAMCTGACICVGTDGTRFIREDAFTRHGKAYDHGVWHIPNLFYRPFFIIDDQQKQVFIDSGRTPDTFEEMLYSADTAEELAEQIGADPALLARTIERFNSYAESGEDIEFDRPAETMRPFEGTLYAVPLQRTVLNTQGGPRRNGKAQIMGIDGNPIPGLFGAGECGGLNTHYYNGGGNVAECLVFGRIAGTNAALGVE